MNALLTRILRYVDFDVSIFTKLEGLRHQIEVYRPGQQIVNEGDTVVSALVAAPPLSAWAISYLSSIAEWRPSLGKDLIL